ncbi:MAG: M13 family metallopeptidase [Oscillospiraceae bacterium]|nr:M13 family metallopeptidase [Oscillospiraceae bacterium]
MIKKVLAACLCAALILASMTGCFDLFRAISDNAGDIFESPVPSYPDSLGNFESNDKLLKDDFYYYVNKDWIENTYLGPVPAANASSELASEIYVGLLYSLLDIAADLETNDDGEYAKLVKYYLTLADVDSRNAEGIRPLQSRIDAIKNIKTIDELQKVAASLDVDCFGSFMMFGIYPDAEDSLTNRLYLSGPLLSLGEKSYYSGSGELSQKTIGAYKTLLAELFTLAGESGAQAMAEEAFRIEKTLADSTLSMGDAVNIDKTYNRRDLREYAAQFENFDLIGFLERVGLVDPEFIIVTELDYYNTLNQIMVPENLEALKSFMYGQLLYQAAGYLSMDFVYAARDFENVLNGTEGYRDETEMAFFKTESYLGELMGKLYVETAFAGKAETAKAEATKIAQEILDKYEERIMRLDWMSDATKAEAVKKLETMDLKIGFPDKWTNFDSLEVTIYAQGGSALQNFVNYYHFSYQEFLDSLDKPVDKDKWSMMPHVVNAGYNRSANEIVIPAASLEEPFFNVDWSEAMNYGGIGFTIAHEISHAFDNEGSKYDENGNYKDWWTAEDKKNYELYTKALAGQFSKIEVLPGYFIHGELTLGENIADLGGMECIVEIVSGKGGNLDELFKNYARGWASKCTDEYLKNSLVQDVHSPDKYRVNTILSNIDKFYETYGIKQGDGMYRPENERVHIW